jgi:hypothetical protein
MYAGRLKFQTLRRLVLDRIRLDWTGCTTAGSRLTRVADVWKSAFWTLRKTSRVARQLLLPTSIPHVWRGTTPAEKCRVCCGFGGDQVLSGMSLRYAAGQEAEFSAVKTRETAPQQPVTSRFTHGSRTRVVIKPLNSSQVQTKIWLIYH